MHGMLIWAHIFEMCPHVAIGVWFTWSCYHLSEPRGHWRADKQDHRSWQHQKPRRENSAWIWQTQLIRQDITWGYSEWKKRSMGGGGVDKKMLVIVADWLRSEVGRMLGTCDSVHQRWCNTLLVREIPFLSYKNRAGCFRSPEASEVCSLHLRPLMTYHLLQRRAFP